MTITLMFISNHLQPLINSVGLIFDIVGACLVAWEVVIQFNNERFKPIIQPSPLDSFRNAESRNPVIFTPPAEETNEYKEWERTKYRKMKLGLAMLIIGFVIQITSNWV
jgi:hypothetical protein